MAVRKIYINPGDLIIVRVIDNPSFGKNEREWSGSKPHPFTFNFIAETHGVTFNDTGLEIGMQMSSQAQRRRLN